MRMVEGYIEKIDPKKMQARVKLEAHCDSDGNPMITDWLQMMHENRGDEPLPDPWEEYLAERIEVLCPKVTRRLEERKVELLGRRVDRHDRERQERVNRNEHYRSLGVKNCRLLSADRKEVVARLKPAVGMKHRLPRKDANYETRPERKHYGASDDCAPAAVHSGYRVGAGNGEDDGPDRDFDGNANRVPDDRRSIQPS